MDEQTQVPNQRGALSPFVPPPAAPSGFGGVNPVDNSTPFNMSDPVTAAQSKPAKQTASTPNFSNIDIMNSPFMKSYQNVAGKYDREIASKQKELSDFEGVKAGFDAEREAGKQKRYIEASEQEQKTLADTNILNRLKDNEEKSTIPFVPTQDNAQDLVTLFSLIGIIGFGIGAGAKGNAQAAMAGMTGMFKGYREGRADLYKKEKIAFDENLRQLKAKTDTLYKEYEAIAKVAANNRQLAREQADLLFAQQGASFVKQYQDKYGIEKTLVMLKEQKANATKALEFAQREADRAEQRAERRQNHQDMLNLRYATLAAKGGGGGALPKDAATSNEHRFRHSTINTVREVLDDLQDEKVRELIGPTNKITPDILLNLQTGYPALASKLAQFESQEFKIGGKALTESEQRILAPIYSWRDMTLDGLTEKLKEADRSLDKEQLYLENRFPGLQQIDYDKPRGSTTPASAASPAARAAPVAPTASSKAPKGVAQSDWDYMTPDERKLWKKTP